MIKFSSVMYLQLGGVLCKTGSDKVNHIYPVTESCIFLEGIRNAHTGVIWGFAGSSHVPACCSGLTALRVV